MYIICIYLYIDRFIYIYSILYKQDLNLEASEAETDKISFILRILSPFVPPYLSVPPVCSSIQTVLMLHCPWWTEKCPFP